MSRRCMLTNQRSQKNNKISIERSRVTKRTISFSQVNLHKFSTVTENLGNLSLKIANRTRRTILKYGGMENYLMSVKRGHLSDKGKALRKTLLKKTVLKKVQL